MKQSPSDAAAAEGAPPGTPLVIGWKEYAALPDWNVRRLKVKVDTGARTSALDAVSYDLEEVAGVGLIARLRLALDRKHPERLTVVQAPVVKMIVVRSSTGMSEQRPVVETRVRLGPWCKPVRLSVTNRAGMLFRVILGRKALAGEFVVDVSKKYLLRKR